MKDVDCVAFLQWALPRLQMRWAGFRKVRRQVCKRIDRRLRELCLDDPRAYRDYLTGHPEEWAELEAMCRIPISRFYRDRGVFDCLRDQILPELAADTVARGEPALRIWSAGCASGEEAYTLGIMWQLDIGPRFPEIELSINATDIDEQMLARARRACYSRSSIKDIPKYWREAAFVEQEQEFCVKPVFRKWIEFHQQDIRIQMPAGQFHMILCRHLAFTYFDGDLQRSISRQLIDRLEPGGVLVTGKQETSPADFDSLHSVKPPMGIYVMPAIS
ncbi:MAG: CheR family methyltransferase [Pirellulaceae bacterium]